MTAETDLLLPVSSGNSMTRQPRYNCLTISNWALAVALIIALIVDITLRTHQAANSDSDEPSISPTTLYVLVDIELVANCQVGYVDILLFIQN